MNIKKIYIRKRTLKQWMTLYLAVFPFFLAFLQEFLGLPGAVKYTMDVAWVGILVLTLTRKSVAVRKKVLPLLLIVLAFFVHCFIIYGFRFQSPIYFLWGFRNNFRFYVAFFSFVAFLDREDVESYFDLLDILFWINALVTFVQYFFLGYSWDYLGGIFGVNIGCNSNTLLFFGMILPRSILQMMHDKSKTWSCIAHLLTASIIAAMAELKVFFVVLIMILFLAISITSFSWRKILLALMMVLCLSLGSTILVRIFGESSNLSIENILELIFAKSYSTQSDLGRLTAIPILSRTILTEPFEQLAGLGLGNCDTSSFAICNTPFYETYSYLNYTWFSSAFLFLETGYIGLTLYLSFFVVSFFIAVKQAREAEEDKLYCHISMIASAVCVVLTIYNASLRMEIGYLAYFALALPHIRRKTVMPQRSRGY